MKVKSLVLIIGFCISLSTYAEDNDGTFAFILDNDLFTATDKNYTNGVRLSWLSETAESGESGFFGSDYAQWLKNTFDFLPYINSGDWHNASLSLGQIMFTPEEITKTKRLPDQAPYVGYLYASTALFSWSNENYHEYEITIGAVGPDSGAAQTQKFVHEVIGADEPRGWKNQVGRHYVAQLAYSQGHRHIRKIKDNGMGWDFSTGIGIEAGNYEVSGHVGGIIRWGKNLPQSFTAYYSDSGSESALLGLFKENSQTGWMLYSALFANGLAYSLIEEEIKDTHTLDIDHGSADLIIGGSYYNNQFEIGMNLQHSTVTVRDDKDPIRYGSIYMIWNI